jgi:hypothetical protein
VRYLGVNNAPRTAVGVVRFAGWYWVFSLPVWLVVGALVLGAVLLVIRPRRVFFALYGMLALQSALFILYVARGVDALVAVTRYVGDFYQTVPLLVVISVAAHAILCLGQSRALSALATRVPAVAALRHRLSAGRNPPRGRSARAARARTGALLATAAAALVAVSLVTTAPTYPASTPDYAAAAADLRTAPQRAGRTVDLDFYGDHWPHAAGLGAAFQRAGLPWCIANPRWTNMFTDTYMCHGSTPRWTVAMLPTRVVPAGTVVLWSDGGFSVVPRDPQAALLTRTFTG